MKKILLVEDDFFIRDIYEKTFRKAGYEVSSAVNGDDALKEIAKNKYDAILLDIMIPMVNGLDVLKAARQPGSLAKDTPILLLTNLGQEVIIKQAFALGADGYLLKAQLNPKQVIEEVEALLNRGK